jgi:hypothetical protein
MVVPEYGVLRMSTYDLPFDITEDDGSSYTYTPQGVLLSVSEFNNEIQPTKNDVTISLAAIDQSFVAGMMGYALKGSLVSIRRVFFDAATGIKLNIAGNPSVRFKGIIANYSFNDEYNQFTDSTSTTISVSCSNITSILETKINQQLTNNNERNYLYPGSYLTANITGGTGFEFRVLTTSSVGAITSVGDISGGTGYTNGTYTAVATTTTSGTGSGATITVVVSGNAITSVTVVAGGTAYRGDDRGFDRVATIANTNFNFGKPYTGA